MAEAPVGDASVLLDSASAALVELGWDPEGSRVEGVLVGTYRSDSGTWPFVVESLPDEQLLVAYSIAPDPVPSERREEMVRFVARANDGLPRANLEIDVETGVVRCHTYLDVAGLDVGKLQVAGFLVPLVRRCLLANFATFDLYYPVMRRVAAGEQSAAEADAEVLALD